MAVNLDQYVFRIRTDATKAEGGTPVWAAAESVNAPVSADKPFRVRIGVSNASPGVAGPNQPYNIRYSRNGGAYTQVSSTASGNPVYATDATAGASADDSAITTILLTAPTVGVGVKQNGAYDFTGSVTSSIGVCGAGRWFEAEYGLAINSAIAVPGDLFTFRIYIGSNAFANYSFSPGVIFAKPAGASALMMGV